MIEPRFVRQSATRFVRIFRAAAATCEDNSELLQRLQPFLRKRIAGISKARRPWNPVLLALRIDRPELHRDIRNGVRCDSFMIPRVIANLEPILMQLSNLFPRHVVRLIRLKFPAFGDKKSCTELMLQQQRPRDREVRLTRVIKRQHHQLVRYRLQSIQPRSTHQQQNHCRNKAFHAYLLFSSKLADRVGPVTLSVNSLCTLYRGGSISSIRGPPPGPFSSSFATTFDGFGAKICTLYFVRASSVPSFPSRITSPWLGDFPSAGAK